MKIVSQVLIAAGILAMVYGIITAGLTYRDMRIQRLLHEPIEVMKIDLSYRSRWQSVSLPLYQQGKYRLYLRLSYPGAVASADTLRRQRPFPFKGGVRFSVEDDKGSVITRPHVEDSLTGSVRQDQLLWVLLDTLRVDQLPDHEWKIQSQVVDSDLLQSGRFADVLLVPPEAAEFLPYVQGEAPKLYMMAVVIMFGFITLLAGGYLSRRLAGE